MAKLFLFFVYLWNEMMLRYISKDRTREQVWSINDLFITWHKEHYVPTERIKITLEDKIALTVQELVHLTLSKNM